MYATWLLGHLDSVGAVADGERVHLELLLDDAHDVRLLQRRRPAAQHGAAVRRQLQEQVLELYGRISSTFQDFFTHFVKTFVDSCYLFQ